MRHIENRLVEVRLGIASSLFAALRHKHSPTAAHSLRVALGCSSWAFALGLEPDQRDELEVAALLHDIGKIGAPDCLLLKPGALAEDEAQLMDQYRLSGLDILSNCCPSSAIVEIIRHSAGWYDGSRPNYPLAAKDIPDGARILAIVDAFDSMTSDQVYRPAMSRERALHELFSRAGTQFDPDLVKLYSELQITVQLHRKVVGHWLAKLDPRQSNRFWRNLTVLAQPPANPEPEALFQQKLLDTHVRRGDLCRPQHADHPVESRCRAIDGHRRIERVPPYLVADLDRHARRSRSGHWKTWIAPSTIP